MEDGIYLRINIGDASLREAYDQTDDPSFWDEAMPPILYHYRLTVAEYWELTVAEHRRLFDWLIQIGAINAES
jgi:hypothetical protein